MKKKLILILFILFVLYPKNVFASIEKDGWIKENDGNIYYYKDGIELKGLHVIDGNKYHFGEVTGQLKRGWSITLDKREYYSDSDGVVQEGFKEIDGNTYYFTFEEGMYKGLHVIDGNKYHFGEVTGQLKIGWSITLDKREYYSDSNGVVQEGFKEIDGNTYYFTFEEGMYKGLHVIDGNKYHFGEVTGQLKRGWSITLDKREYYSDSNGVVQEGFKEIDGNTYYFTFEEGMYKNSKVIGGIEYFFNDRGILLDKWVTIDENTYYYKDGKILKGLHIIDGNKYHFGEVTGQLKRGWSITLDKREYYSDSNGVVQEGFKEIDGNTYYFTFEEGMYKGLHVIDGNKYHFGEVTGQLKRGWSITLDKREYYSDSNGVVQEGFKEIDGNTYYFTFEEGMYKGLHVINGNKYHFGEVTGQLKRGWSITLAKKNYYSTNDGVIVTGNQFIDGNWYSFADDGSLKDGWQTINGKKYYFYSDGSRAKYIAKIAGVRYEFSATGELEHENIKIIADISKHQGYINWDVLWASGEIDGVILRVGYSLGMDSMFMYNLTQVNRLKIPYTIYHFSIAENAYEAQLEANHLVEWYTKNSLKPFMDVFYDIESWKEGNSSSDFISISDYDSIISTYKSILNNNGIGMSVYTGKNYAETRLSDYGRTQIGWIAHYASYCGYNGSYRGWQYTSKGSLQGISGNVDLSIFYW